MDKGIANVRPFDKTLPLRPIEIKLENKKVLSRNPQFIRLYSQIVFGNEIADFDAR